MRRASAVAVTLVVAGGVVAYTQSAGAAYKPSITQVQAQVNSLQAQVDQVGQQYVQVGAQLTAAKSRLAAVERVSGADAQRFAVAEAQLRQVAVASFENANQTSVANLLTSGDPTEVLREASLIDQMADTHSKEADKFLAAAQQVATAQQQVQRTEQGVAQLQAQLTTKKNRLDKLLNASTATLENLSLQQQAEVAAAAIGGGTFDTSATDPYPQNTAALRAVHFVYGELGTWYLWGGTGPQYDCSGLVQAAWAYAGVSIPRTTYDQYATLPHVSKGALQPGDLVFFNGIGHVCMYVGNGLMIDAPRTGEQIRLLPLDTSWYADSYDGAARP